MKFDALNQYFTWDVREFATLIITLSGTWVGEVTYEYSDDRVTWHYLGKSRANGDKTLSVSTLKYVRAKVTMLTSGEIEFTAVMKASGGTGADTQAENVEDIEGLIGATTDAAITTDTTGTVSGKLRGLVKIFADVWSSVLHSFGAHLTSAISGEDLTNNVLGVQNKPVASASYSPSLYAPLTQVTKNVIKASAGNVLSIYITNDNAAVRYFQLHNKATAPAAGEAPVRSLKVPAGTANNPGVLILGREFFGPGGQYFATGIGWAISTTFATFTDSATNTEHIVNVDYI